MSDSGWHYRETLLAGSRGPSYPCPENDPAVRPSVIVPLFGGFPTMACVSCVRLNALSAHAALEDRISEERLRYLPITVSWSKVILVDPIFTIYQELVLH
uniref:Uncharacterized protein n=1 Tax=Agaricus bisporus virus 7 TaxID=1945751 RepID=A0A1Q1N6H5_9VIRU|nr:hypothetical protein [Agaricus bisporus virus 7]